MKDFLKLICLILPEICSILSVIAYFASMDLTWLAIALLFLILGKLHDLQNK